ncbi:MAG: hypothetical protein R3A10_07840 [Caldilineaceae bacterium]
MERLARAAARYDWRVLGYGIQPVTPPACIMSRKQRYVRSLYRAMGRQWLWYTVTASDQGARSTCQAAGDGGSAQLRQPDDAGHHCALRQFARLRRQAQPLLQRT